MKRKNNIIGILIILAGVIIIGLVAAFSIFSYRNTVQYFKSTKRSAAENLYNKIISVDLDEQYPQTPDEVVGLANDIIYLMYGDMIIENSLYEDLVIRSRKLYGNELLELNTQQDQLANILKTVDNLAEKGVCCFNYEQLPTIYDSFDSGLCFIRIKQTYSNGEKFYWEYEVQRNVQNGNWQIIRWDRTNENYEPIAE